MTKNKILSILQQSKDKLKREFHLKDIWLFGSFVRGEQRGKSDVDVLVDFDDGATLFDWAGLGIYLEEKLGRKVDIVTKKSVRPQWKRAIFKEMIQV